MLAFYGFTSHGRNQCTASPAYLTLLLLLSLLVTPIWSSPITIPWPKFRKTHYNDHTPPPDCNCTSPGHGHDHDHDHETNFQKRNFNTISSIYSLTVFPNQVPIVTGGAAGVPPGLFSHEVTGRVDPVGEFRGFEDSIEYFFALAPLPQGNPLNAAITSFKITEFSSGCKNVAASVVWLFCSIVNPGCPDDGKVLPPLKQVAFWKFDDQGEVVKYDALIPNLNSWVVQTTGVPVFGPPEAQLAVIQQICAVTMDRCQGKNQQWDSMEQCVGDLSRRPFGNYDEAWGDNIVCRSIHLVLTQVRPDVSTVVFFPSRPRLPLSSFMPRPIFSGLNQVC